MSPALMLIRNLDRASDAEIALVAERMQSTLVEVLGGERAKVMYSMRWLEQRVRWHLHAWRAEVLLAIVDDQIVGHTIVRVELHDDAETGLFATTFVAPEFRRLGTAAELIGHGETWMRSRRMATSATWTATGNTKLVELYRKLGYAIVDQRDDMVRLTRNLA